MRSYGSHKSMLLVVLALLCAMASSGFAHRFVGQPVDPALAAYIAAGGSLDDICGHAGGTTHHQSTQTCDACRLVTAAVLTDHEPDFTTPFGTISSVALFVSPLSLRAAPLDTSRTARGPPAT
jgi:hypothetical protein